MPFPIYQHDGIHSFKKLLTFVTTASIKSTGLGFAEHMMPSIFCATSFSYVTIDFREIPLDLLTVTREPLTNECLYRNGSIRS